MAESDKTVVDDTSKDTTVADKTVVADKTDKTVKTAATDTKVADTTVDTTKNVHAFLELQFNVAVWANIMKRDGELFCHF